MAWPWALWGLGGYEPPRPKTKTNWIQPPMVLASPGFWPQAERALPQLDVASWGLGVPNTCLGR